MRCAKVNLTVSEKEAVNKFLKDLKEKRKSDFPAESRNGKEGLLTPMEPPRSSWLWPGPTNRQI